MDVIIIEDEKAAARYLQRKLKKLGLEANTLLHSVAGGITWFQQNPAPDLIFLDIQLSDGISFEIFEKVSVNSAIIFTTAYDEYALRAFKLNSIDYLLKPIDEEELAAAIKMFKENYLKEISGIDLQAFRKMLDGEPVKDYKKRITIQVGQHLKIVEIDDVTCFYSENKGTYLATNSGKNYLLDTSLENLEKELDLEKFFRINRKAIVKLQSIEDIIAYTNSRLQLKINNFSEFQLIVSRERVKQFKSWIS